MLSNGFTNWDDQLYITENMLLRGPDWHGIFTQPVVSNYHPLTVASLALNYQLSGLKPFSYHFVDWAFHIANTALVFFLAYRLSGSNRWVSFLTALFFGIHPMHVESVAWTSERKDVLFCFFFLLSMLSYLRYLRKPGWESYTGALVLFALSLVSKPAAVTLPVVLLLVDWYRGRSLKDTSVWLEKLPFFALALVFGLLTVQIQSEKAIADPTYYPLWQRFVFAVYGFGEYIKKLFFPFKLATIHPFPDAGVIPVSYYPGIFLAFLKLGMIVFLHKNKHVMFGVGFYAINLALVLQLMPFGNSVVSERYTYVPYIGLVFGIMMNWATAPRLQGIKNAALGVFLVAAFVFAILANKQVKVWKDSLTLWTKAIEIYPDSYIARSNRGHYLANELKQYDQALADYTVALETEPQHPNSLDNRTVIYLHKENYEAAYADADNYVRYHPNMYRAYLLRAFTADRLKKYDQALADYAKCIELEPENEEPRGNRGVIYYNAKQDYKAAKADFDAGIRLNPKKGVNYVNRARCWVQFGNKAEAQKDIETAKQLGEKVDDNLIKAVEAMP